MHGVQCRKIVEIEKAVNASLEGATVRWESEPRQQLGGLLTCVAQLGRGGIKVVTEKQSSFIIPVSLHFNFT